MDKIPSYQLTKHDLSTTQAAPGKLCDKWPAARQVLIDMTALLKPNSIAKYILISAIGIADGVIATVCAPK